MMTIVLPFSLFIGSAVIGFLGYYQIEGRGSFIWFSPALYLDLIGVFLGILNFSSADARSFLFVTLTGLWWLIVSLAGIELGYKIREHFSQ
jgi:hypothetical protein